MGVIEGVPYEAGKANAKIQEEKKRNISMEEPSLTKARYAKNNQAQFPSIFKIWELSER